MSFAPRRRRGGDEPLAASTASRAAESTAKSAAAAAAAAAASRREPRVSPATQRRVETAPSRVPRCASRIGGGSSAARVCGSAASDGTGERLLRTFGSPKARALSATARRRAARTRARAAVAGPASSRLPALEAESSTNASCSDSAGHLSPSTSTHAIPAADTASGDACLASETFTPPVSETKPNIDPASRCAAAARTRRANLAAPPRTRLSTIATTMGPCGPPCFADWAARSATARDISRASASSSSPSRASASRRDAETAPSSSSRFDGSAQAGKSRCAHASHATHAAAASSAAPSFCASAVSCRSATRTLCAARCTPGASTRTPSATNARVAAHRCAMSRVAASLAARRPPVAAGGHSAARRSVAAASSATWHQPARFSAPRSTSSLNAAAVPLSGRACSTASTAHTQSSSRNCGAAAAASAAAASALSAAATRRASSASARFLADLSVAGSTMVDALRSSMSSSMPAARAARSAAFRLRSAVRRAARSSSRKEPMISPSGVITTMASGCVRSAACAASARATTATRTSRREGRPRFDSSTSARIARRGCEMGMEGSESATASVNAARESGATASPARRGTRGASRIAGFSFPAFRVVDFDFEPAGGTSSSSDASSSSVSAPSNGFAAPYSNVARAPDRPPAGPADEEARVASFRPRLAPSARAPAAASAARAPPPRLRRR